MDKVELVLKIVAQICPFVQIGPETELIDSGILTSVDLFDLITELETEFDIRIDEQLIEAENFATVKKIVEVVLQGDGC